VRVLVDTGVFSAALSRRRRPKFDRHVQLMIGNQVFLAAATISELRYGALVAEWKQHGDSA
jgi:predicted nucleic acid-binding protein